MDKKYHKLLELIEPYIITAPSSLEHFSMKYMGLQIDPSRVYHPFDSRGHAFAHKILKLDELSFGPGGMGMPRWVLFDCALVPGAVVGFGINSRLLSSKDRELLAVKENEFVPVSMYIAIPSADKISWFGHNLSSLNSIVSLNLSGLGLLTKYFALGVLNIKQQIGATQWNSKALGLHLKLAPMRLLSAYIPIHSEAESLCYESEDFYDLEKVFTKNTESNLSANFEAKQAHIKELQLKIERGEDVHLLAKLGNHQFLIR